MYTSNKDIIMNILNKNQIWENSFFEIIISNKIIYNTLLIKKFYIYIIYKGFFFNFTLLEINL